MSFFLYSLLLLTLVCAFNSVVCTFYLLVFVITWSLWKKKTLKHVVHLLSSISRQKIAKDLSLRKPITHTGRMKIMRGMRFSVETLISFLCFILYICFYISKYYDCHSKKNCSSVWHFVMEKNVNDQLTPLSGIYQLPNGVHSPCAFHTINASPERGSALHF